jgi:hypothetical protein
MMTKMVHTIATIVVTCIVASSIGLLGSSVLAAPIAPEGGVLGSLSISGVSGAANSARSENLEYRERMSGLYRFRLRDGVRTAANLDELPDSVWPFDGKLVYKRGKRKMTVSSFRMDVKHRRITAMFRGRRTTVVTLLEPFEPLKNDGSGEPFTYDGRGRISIRFERAVFRVKRRHSGRRVAVDLRLRAATLVMTD